MLLNMTDEQNMLEEMVSGLVSEAVLDEQGEVTLALWSQMAELGLLAISFAEDDGGLGGSAADLCIVARQLGKTPGELPFMGSLVLGSAIIRDLATQDQKAKLFDGLMGGTEILALAHDEPGARYDLSHVTTKISQQNGQRILNGNKTAVIGGAGAGHFMVSARTSGDTTNPAGLSLFIVPANADGVQVMPYVTHDGRHDADIVFNEVSIADGWQLGEIGAAAPVMGRLNDLAIAVSCAEAVGAMEELLDLTVEYLQIRKQFGVPLASFQALKHKAVDMFIELEQAKSMTAYAVMSVDEDGHERDLALKAAKAQVNAAARFVAETAVQLHGAIGMTIETKTGRLFQRLTNFQLRFGDRHHCLQQLSDAPTSILET